MRSVAGHPALLCYALGNEIPATLARWLGRRRIERFLERLYRAVKAEDPEGLVTYVNYPTTEYLQLPFLDLLAFNVYLESRQRLEAYIARLQNIAGDRPLLMSEVGLDAMRNGEARQAEVLDWQIRTSFTVGLRRRVRLLVDGRVVPGRIPGRRLGLRPHAAATARPKPALSGRVAGVRGDVRSPRTSGGRASPSCLLLQRIADDPADPGGRSPSSTTRTSR